MDLEHFEHRLSDIVLDIKDSLDNLPKLIAEFKETQNSKEHEWKEGDWVYDKEYGIVKIITVGRTKGYQVTKVDIDIIAFGEENKENLRPLTPSDWTREVDGVKYRAYWDEEDLEDVVIYYKEENGVKGWEIDIYNRSFCRLAGIPIMPYELSQGKYEYPT